MTETVVSEAQMERAVEENQQTKWNDPILEDVQNNVNKNPWDLESWTILLHVAQTRLIDNVRPFYENLITTFPTSSRFWKFYIEKEICGQNFKNVEKLFQRCLNKVFNIELFKLYLTYVKEAKSMLQNYNETIVFAYDFALDKIGMDINSYSIWQDYITVLSNIKAVEGSYAENSRISAIRKVYQKGIINPMINIELLWKDYLAFEQSVNIGNADTIITDQSKKYMNARGVTKEYQLVINGLKNNVSSVPPIGSLNEMKQVELWKKYIIWEKSDPLLIEDIALIKKRVMFAFNQAFSCMAHYPNFWYEAVQFLEMNSKIYLENGDPVAAELLSNEVANIYESGICAVLNTSMLLCFAYADFEEGRMNYKKVHSIYNNFLKNEMITDTTLTYIQYMKFARRTEGIRSTRAIFKTAREDSRCKYHVYIFAAYTEYYFCKDVNIAINVFEFGLRKFYDNFQYVIKYIDFLSYLNDNVKVRASFIRVLSLTSLSPENSIEILNRFLEFESYTGNLSNIVEVKKRRSAVLDKLTYEDKDTVELLNRFRFYNLYPFALSSIGFNKESINVSTTMRPAQIFTFDNGLNNLNNQPNKKDLPLPDLSQMIPYKPKLNVAPGSHIVPGGIFPPPPAACDLLKRLPSNCFHGPFVSVDMLMDNISKLVLPENLPVPKAKTD